MYGHCAAGGVPRLRAVLLFYKKAQPQSHRIWDGNGSVIFDHYARWNFCDHAAARVPLMPTKPTRSCLAMVKAASPRHCYRDPTTHSAPSRATSTPMASMMSSLRIGTKPTRSCLPMVKAASPRHCYRDPTTHTAPPWATSTAMALMMSSLRISAKPTSTCGTIRAMTTATIFATVEESVVATHALATPRTLATQCQCASCAQPVEVDPKVGLPSHTTNASFASRVRPVPRGT